MMWNVVAPSTICTISSSLGWCSHGPFAGEFGNVDGAVAVRRQAREGALAPGCGCLRGASAQHPQLGELGLQIDDGEHSSLRLAMTDASHMSRRFNC